ncbi:lysine transporter LysE [Bacterioplanes sanyensis]|uniref:LysE family translocator n=1 Tax=Bacterioplanes sanyensis TaxID=1249553 RepID=UPI0016729DB7|nr:LysE family translocator [Bacterioplanes sanyensis]GGY41857.1 lysine transporter LysE [Bacterioplanes sanyensis]
MTFTLWLSLLVVCLLGAMSPGPSLAIMVKHALSSGRPHALAAAWSHALGIGIYAAATVAGLTWLLQQAQWLFTAISVAGAVYLAYLGWQALRAKGGVMASLTGGAHVPLHQAAKEGILISLLNPKIALFFAALFSQFLTADPSWQAKLLLVITPLLVDGLWYTLIALLMSHPKIVPALQQRGQLIDRISGGILLLLAARVVTQI